MARRALTEQPAAPVVCDCEILPRVLGPGQGCENLRLARAADSPCLDVLQCSPVADAGSGLRSRPRGSLLASSRIAVRLSVLNRTLNQRARDFLCPG